jgi:quinol-cytochrome oxidoreductase complex cytochrome b subunit
MPFVPHFALRDVFGWTVALFLLAGLSAYLPWELGTRADPFAPAPAGIRPEWYFLWTFQALKYMPAHVLGVDGELVAITVFGLGGVALLFLPFLDRGTLQSGRLISWAATVALVFMALMTVLALTGGESA